MNKALTLLVILIPFLMSSYSVFSIVYFLRVIADEFKVPLPVVSGVITTSFIGGSIGGLVIGAISDAYGRRIGILASVILFSIFTIIAGYASNLIELYIIWFMVGFGVNAENGISYAVVAENWSKGRGLMGGFMQGLYFVGLVLGSLTAVLTGNWTKMALTTGLVSMIVSIPSALLIPETIRRRSIRNISYSNLFKGRYLKITLWGTVLVASAFLYTIPLVSLAPTYMHALNAPGSMVILLPVLGIASFMLAGLLSDKYGRGIVEVAMGALASVTGLLTMVLALLHYPGILITLISLDYFSTGIFAYLGVWLSELYPTEVRATGSNFTFTLGRILGGFGPLIVTLISSNLGFSMGVVLATCGVLVSLSALRLMT